MFKKINFLLFVILTILSSITIEAVEIKDLYQASVAIKSQSSGDRANALKKALAAVMLKVGGEQSVLDNEIIKQSLKDFDSYLNQYRYQEKSIKIEDQLGSKKQLFILASFNEEKINQLFQQANLPLWGSLRPQILLWLIEEQGLQRSIVSNSSFSTLPYKVNEFSTQRGLPIIMPLMDLTDFNQLTISDVWGRFQQPIKEASSRYLAEAIVVMRISNSSLLTDSYTDNYTDTAKIETSDCALPCVESKVINHNYVLDWSLLDWGLIEGQQKLSRQYLGDNPQELLQHGLADITELIYQRYALSTAKQHDLVIEVANIDNLATYVDVFNFLNNLSAVKSATLISAKGSARRFNLQLLGSSDALLASLKLDNTLIQIIYPLAQFNAPTPKEGEGILVPIFNWSK
jgi:hypothetical protein